MRQAIRKEEETRRKEDERQSEEAARRERDRAEATSRAFGAWIKTSNLSSEECREIGDITARPSCRGRAITM